MSSDDTTLAAGVGAHTEMFAASFGGKWGDYNLDDAT